MLLIMTDDSGFGAPSTFGGVVPTPALDRIAKNGLRYTNFHSTSLCSPTRAALITGRNHHSVGFGVVGEIATGFPGYDSIIREREGHHRHDPEGQRLRHLVVRQGPQHAVLCQASQAGPFEQWPNGMGFEYFYGFVGGDASQWQPNLFRNTTPIFPFEGNPGWNLHHGDGRRGDPVHERQSKELGAGEALLRLLRARRHACAASSDAGVDQEDQRHAPVRPRLGRSCARPSSPTRSGSASCRRTRS